VGRCCDQGGFQLIEVLITCLFLGLLATFGVGSLTEIADRYRLETSARLIANGLSAGRTQAVCRNLALEFRVDVAANRFGIAAPGDQPETWGSLAKGVSFVQIPGRSITFYSRGSVVPAGSFVLGNGEHRIKIIMSPGGRVRWERID
jgi:Tfp pilus assembly protein FimT